MNHVGFAMQNYCVLCHQKYSTETISFEQRLVDDKDFCIKCWNEIMGAEYEERRFPFIETL